MATQRGHSWLAGHSCRPSQTLGRTTQPPRPTSAATSSAACPSIPGAQLLCSSELPAPPCWPRQSELDWNRMRLHIPAKSRTSKYLISPSREGPDLAVHTPPSSFDLELNKQMSELDDDKQLEENKQIIVEDKQMAKLDADDK